MSDFVAPEGLTLAVDGSTLLIANWVTLPTVGGSEPYSPAAASALSAATPEGVAAITSVTVKKKGGTETSTAVEDVNAALACFTGIVSVTEQGEATVTYDFGVSELSITPTGDGAMTGRITFKVQGAMDSSGANFAEGVIFAMMNAADQIGETVLASTANGTLETTTETSNEAGERTFTFTFTLPESEVLLLRARVMTP